jgi:hypothetical protein
VYGPGPVTLHGYVPASSSVKIQVFTLAFRKVREINLAQVAAGTELNLTLNDDWGNILANGLYYLLVTTNQGRRIGKLLILR